MTLHKPEVGAWYVNLTGQLMKVWAVRYAKKHLDKVVLEFLNGSRKIIDIDEWNHLELEVNVFRARSLLKNQ